MVEQAESTGPDLDPRPAAFDPPVPSLTGTGSPMLPPATVRWAVTMIAVASGLFAALGNLVVDDSPAGPIGRSPAGPIGWLFAGSPAPTGAPLVDTVLVGLAVGFVTWLGAAALRWDIAVVSIVAGVTSWSLPGAVIGIVNGIVGYALPDRRGAKSVITAAMAGIAMNVASRGNLGMPGAPGNFGLSSILGIGLGLVVAVLGLRRRNRATRRFVMVAALVVVPLVLIGAVGVAYGAWASRADLRAADTNARQALEHLGHGDIDEARAAFSTAAIAFDRADGRLSNPAAQLARFVPVVAQHHRAASELSAEAAAASTAIAEELERVDLDALTIVDGRIDLAKVRALQPPLLAIQRRIAELGHTLDDVRSPWLVTAATDRIDDLADDVAAQRVRSDDALAVASAAPALLGGDGERVYFIAFTTPAESRGLGGFMGNWAELTVDDGAIALTRFGRTEDLDDGAAPGTRFLTGPADWLTRYGPFRLASGENGSTETEAFKNITMSPSMESTGQVIAELYPQSGGRELDGVFAMDVYTLARLLRFTGPIALPDGIGPDGGRPITADDAARFLLNDQYDVTELDTRVDVLSEFSNAVVDALLSGSLPPPTELVDVLGPMVDQGRLSAYAVRGTEQDLLHRLGLSGTLPLVDGTPGASPGDAIAIAFNNAVGNKIDYYLASSATYTVSADARSNTATATLALTMTNGAPVDGEPSYVIGNPIGLPVGENRTYVTVFSRLPVHELQIDGKRVDAEPGFEAGYFTTSAFVQLAAGESTTLTLTMDGPIDLTDGYVLDARTPPTVAPTPIEVEVDFRRAGTHEGDVERVVATRHDPGRLHVDVS